MFGRWKCREKHRADKQQGDPAALEREGDPRGGLQSGPGGAPPQELGAEERHDANR